jgi:putative FmdB family regulatory protein
MPIYEYQCTACSHQLERLQKLSDPPLVECPVCGKPALQKLVSAAGFRLKGGGWYETDFKSGKQKNLAKDEAKPKADDKGKTAAKADAKPSSGDTKTG